MSNQHLSRQQFPSKADYKAALEKAIEKLTAKRDQAQNMRFQQSTALAHQFEIAQLRKQLKDADKDDNI